MGLVFDSSINVDLYQKRVTRIKKYKGNPELYLLGKLSEEAGEISKEIIRKFDGQEVKSDLTSELGDLLWVITAIAEENNIRLSDIIEENIKKLQERNLI